MHINTKDFRVSEGDTVNLKHWPTRIGPVYETLKALDMRYPAADAARQQELLAIRQQLMQEAV